MTATVLSIGLGVFLVLTAALKAFFSRLFIIHVRKLKLLPDQPASLAAVVFIEIEVGLGMALILGIYLHFVVPAAAVMISMLTLLTWRGISKHQVEDCGCYGAFIELSPNLTFLVNGFFLVILACIWSNLSPDAGGEISRVWIVIIVMLLIHLAAKRTVHYPLIDLPGIKIGKPWNSGLLKLGTSYGQDVNSLFFLLDTHCSLCQQWLQNLEEISPDGLDSAAVILFPESSREEVAISGSEISNYPIQYLKPFVFKLLTGRIPMAIRVEQGIIRDLWTGSFPKEYFSA